MYLKKVESKAKREERDVYFDAPLSSLQALHGSNRIDKISEIYRIDINVKTYTSLLKMDMMIKEIMGSHIAIKGAEDFVSQLMEHGKD